MDLKRIYMNIMLSFVTIFAILMAFTIIASICFCFSIHYKLKKTRHHLISKERRIRAKNKRLADEMKHANITLNSSITYKSKSQFEPQIEDSIVRSGGEEKVGFEGKTFVLDILEDSEDGDYVPYSGRYVPTIRTNMFRKENKT